MLKFHELCKSWQIQNLKVKFLNPCFYIFCIIFFVIFFIDIYIYMYKTAKTLSAKYHQENKERLQ